MPRAGQEVNFAAPAHLVKSRAQECLRARGDVRTTMVYRQPVATICMHVYSTGAPVISAGSETRARASVLAVGALFLVAWGWSGMSLYTSSYMPMHRHGSADRTSWQTRLHGEQSGVNVHKSTRGSSLRSARLVRFVPAVAYWKSGHSCRYELMDS